MENVVNIESGRDEEKKNGIKDWFKENKTQVKTVGIVGAVVAVAVVVVVFGNKGQGNFAETIGGIAESPTTDVVTETVPEVAKETAKTVSKVAKA